MRGITKRYPGVEALKGVNLEILPGEVHALVGENGAGKSTLMKLLVGADRADAGEIVFNGRVLAGHTTRDARRAGIGIIYQEFNLIPFLSAVDNIFLGKERTRNAFGFVDSRRQRKEAAELLSSLGIEIDLDVPVKYLSVAQKQLVEIAKALSEQSILLAMDEPSATLTTRELDKLFEIIRRLKAQGISVIYISHRLEEVFEICDRVTVFRDGMGVATRPVCEVNREWLIERMVGRSLSEEFPKVETPVGEELLRVKGLSRAGAFRDVSFSLYRGEILALTGLVGSGRTEVARAIFGADPPDAGQVYFKGRPVRFASPAEATVAGLALLTEDRKSQGLVLGMTVRENVTLSNLAALATAGFVRRKEERAVVDRCIVELFIRTPSREQTVKHLSGGNQQKVVVARWLLSEAELLIFDEPTRGIDVGAKAEIYHLMNRLLAAGKGILMISSELPEVLGMADRIAVMREGRLAGILPRAEATQERIMRLAVA
ncbi:sugar ABC transporter ATP-binding protein [bacterium]|nr:sugar ABC transporter ATP-binding protein [bacterium]